MDVALVVRVVGFLDVGVCYCIWSCLGFFFLNCSPVFVWFNCDTPGSYVLIKWGVCNYGGGGGFFVFANLFGLLCG